MPADAAFDEAIGVQAEGEQHGLFQPLVHDPVAVFAGTLGHAHLAAVEQLQRGIHGFADIASGRGGEAGAVLPGSIDHFGQGFGHVVFLLV